MSVFTQATNTLTTLQSQWSPLQDELNEQVEILQDLDQQQKNGRIDLDVLNQIHEQSSGVASKLTTFTNTFTSLLASIQKFHAKAQDGIKNPDTQIYGASMVTKITKANEEVTKLASEFTPLSESFRTYYSKLEQSVNAAKAEAETKAKAEAAAKLEAEKKAAADRAETERLAKVEAERQRKEAEAAAAAAAKAKAAAAIETARLAQVAQAQRVQEERAAREAVLAERRAAAEQAKASPSPPATAASVGATTVVDSSKPLIERSADSLRAALAEIKRGSTNEEYTIAIQTLLKFLTNIMQNPREEKFRHIRATNEIFQRRLGSRPGGIAALTSIGFTSITTPSTMPAGSDLTPNAEYWKIDAKAELWPVLVQSKTILEDAMKAAGGSVAPTQPAAVAPTLQQPGVPFAGFPYGGLGAGGAGVAPAGGMPGMNPMTMLSDPFMQQMMANPAMLNMIMQAQQGGQLDRSAIMREMMSNPQMLTSMMSSPMVQGMMSNPQMMQHAMAMRGGMGLPPLGGAAPPAAATGAPNPFAAFFGGAQAGQPAAAPAANPMTAWMNMMAQQQQGAASTSAASTPAATPATPVQPSGATPAAAPAAAAPSEEELDEEALAEAIALSMQQPEEKQN